MWLRVKLPETNEVSNFAKHLKEKYNLKIAAIIKVLIMHPEIVEEINELVDKHDTECRFVKYMDTSNNNNNHRG